MNTNDTIEVPKSTVRRGRGHTFSRRGVGRSDTHRRASKRTHSSSRSTGSKQASTSGSSGVTGMVKISPSFDKIDIPIHRVASALPLSLRGVGMCVAQCYSALVEQLPNEVHERCSIHVAFRCCLAQVTLRISESTALCPVAFNVPPAQQHVEIPWDVKRLLEDSRDTFSLIANLAAGIGWFEHGKSMYRTYVPESISERGRVGHSDAFILTALNIRQYLEVAVLADDDEGDEAVVEFINALMIPGLVIRADHPAVMNLDAVVPNNWFTAEALRADFAQFKELLRWASSSGIRHIAAHISYNGGAAPLALIGCLSAEADNSAIDTFDRGGEDVYLVDFPGNSTWFSLHTVEAQAISRGVLTVLGETPFATPAREQQGAILRCTCNWLTLARLALGMSPS